MNSSPEEILEELAGMQLEARAITKEVTDICWYMRGSINWDQAWKLTSKQREIVIKLIKSNIERTEKTRMPLL